MGYASKEGANASDYLATDGVRFPIFQERELEIEF